MMKNKILAVILFLGSLPLFSQDISIQLDHTVYFRNLRISYQKTADIEKQDIYLEGSFKLTINDNLVCLLVKESDTFLDFCDIIKEVELKEFHDYGEGDIFMKLNIITDFEPWTLTMDIAKMKFRIIQAAFPFQDGATGYLEYSLN